ncbi:MAG: phosphate signaling complex protein PhoU [Candidatus Porifericomitaceae bacterium WSBS_2022_MAG_OTU9]
MEQRNYPQHISKQYDYEFEHLRDQFLAMGSLVEKQLESSLQVLAENRTDFSEELMDREKRANRYEVSLDMECVQLLVRRQPAAGDLRLVMAILKSITDLERIGDEAKKIAKRAIRSVPENMMQESRLAISEMGDHGQGMLRAVLDAFARRDASAAVAAASMEVESDKLFRGIFNSLKAHMQEDADSVEHVLDAIWIIRSLERITDHCRNICEYIIYAIEGTDVRHVDIDQMKSKVGV